MTTGLGVDITLGPVDAFLFYSGATAGTTPTPNTVVIDTIELPLDDVTEYRAMSQSTMRDGAVTSSDQSEQLFNAEGAWSRYRYSWFHGASQDFADLREDADPFRFETSVGVNPWTDYELTLQNTMTATKADTTGTPILIESGTYLFFACGSDLYRTDAAGLATNTWQTITVTGVGTIQALATDGTDLYVAHSSGVDKVTGTNTTSTAFSTDITTNTHNLYFVGNRLLAGQANTLVEVAAAGTTTTIKTHFQSAFRWTTVFNIGSRIYIGGYAGIRSELYSVAVDSTGALLQSVESAPLPFGELLYGGYAYAGAVLLLTNKGVRLAQVGGDGTLTYGPLIEITGAVCATAEGRYAWVSDTTNDCLVRLDLATFVEPLLPAHARDIEAGGAGDITAVAHFDGKLITGVSGVGCFKQDTAAYETTGYLDSGIITFGTVEQKVLSEVKVEYEPLASGESVAVEVFDDLGTSLGSESNSIVASEGFTYDLDAEQVRHCQVRITLGGLGTSTPTLKQWRMRAYPVVPPVEQWIVPLMLNSRVRVNNGQGQTRDVDVATVFDAIVELWRLKTAVNFRMGARVERVRIDAYEMRGKKWNDDGSFIEGTLVLRLVKA